MSKQDLTTEATFCVFRQMLSLVLSCPDPSTLVDVFHCACSNYDLVLGKPPPFWIFTPGGLGVEPLTPGAPGLPRGVNDYEKQMLYGTMLPSSTQILAIYAESYEK